MRRRDGIRQSTSLQPASPGKKGRGKKRATWNRPVTCEHLEDRCLLTVTAVWDRLSGELILTGDAANDSITLASTGDSAPWVTLNGSSSLHNGSETWHVPAADVQHLIIQGGSGADTIDLRQLSRLHFSRLVSGTIHVFGQDGNDRVYGSPLSDQIDGGAGDDSLSGGAGEDFLAGHDGSDFIQGGPDRDLLEGHAGQDYLYGDDGDDQLRGGAGDDVLVGNLGADRLEGGDGDDLLLGGPGVDALLGGSGANRMVEDYDDHIQVDHPWATSISRNTDFESPQLTEDGVHGFDAVAGWTAIGGGKVYYERLTEDGQARQYLYLSRQTTPQVAQTLATISGQRYAIQFQHRASPRLAQGANDVQLVVFDPETSQFLERATFLQRAGEDWRDESVVFQATSATTEVWLQISQEHGAFGETDIPGGDFNNIVIQPLEFLVTEDSRVEFYDVLQFGPGTVGDPRPVVSLTGISGHPAASSMVSFSPEGILRFEPGDVFQSLQQNAVYPLTVDYTVTYPQTNTEIEHRMLIGVLGVNDAPSALVLLPENGQALPGTDLVLQLHGVEEKDDGDAIGTVAFLRDANENGQLDTTDELLGYDTSSDQGWSHTIAAGAWENKPAVYFAAAMDSYHAVSPGVKMDLNDLTDLGGLSDWHVVEPPAQYVRNGSFESPVVVDQQYFAGGRRVPHWRTPPSTPPLEIQRTRDTGTTPFPWTAAPTDGGQQWTELDSSHTLVNCLSAVRIDETGHAGDAANRPACTTTLDTSSATVYQNVTVVPWQPYRLSFEFAARPMTGIDNSLDVQVLEANPLFPVSFDAVREQRHFRAEHDFQVSQITWYQEEIQFTPQTDRVRLQFRDSGIDNEVGTWLDHVVLTPVTVPQLTVNSSTTVTEDQSISIELDLNDPAPRDVTVFWQAVAESAEHQLDFTEQPLAMTVIPQGATHGVIEIPLVDDDVRELAETLTVNILGAHQAIPTGNTTLQFTVLDNDQDPGYVSLGDIVYLEDRGRVAVPVHASGNVGPVDLTLQVVGGKQDGSHQPNQVATWGSDFEVPGYDGVTPIAVSFESYLSGATHYVELDLTNNDIFEQDEFFYFELLTLNESYSLERHPDPLEQKGQVTIVNDDAPALLYWETTSLSAREDAGRRDVTVRLNGLVEGGNYSGQVRFVPGHHQHLGDPIGFPPATISPTAGPPIPDLLSPLVVDFNMENNGSANVLIDLQIDGDLELTPEYFFLELVDPLSSTGGAVRLDSARAMTQFTIQPDAAPLEFTIDQADVFDPTATSVDVPVYLSGPVPAGHTLTFGYSTLEFTAEAGVDFVTANNAEVTVGSGATIVWLPVTLIPPASDGRSIEKRFVVRLDSVSTTGPVDFLAPNQPLSGSTVYLRSTQGRSSTSDPYLPEDAISTDLIDRESDALNPWRLELPATDGAPAGIQDGSIILPPAEPKSGALSLNIHDRLNRILGSARFRLQLPASRVEVLLVLKDQQGTELSVGHGYFNAQGRPLGQLMESVAQLDFAELPPDLASGIYTLDTYILAITEPPLPGIEAQTHFDQKSEPYIYHRNDIYEGMGSPLSLTSLQRVYPYRSTSPGLAPGMSEGLGLFRSDGTATFFGKIGANTYHRPRGVFSQLSIVNSAAEYAALRLPHNATRPKQAVAIGFRLTYTDGSYDLFDTEGRQLYTVDSYHNATEYAYDSDTPGNSDYWRLNQIVDPFGVRRSYVYSGDALAEIVESVGATQRTTSLAYGADPLWDATTVEVTAPSGESETYWFSQDQRHLLKHQHRSGRIDTYVHHPEHGLLTEVRQGTLPDGTQPSAVWQFTTSLSQAMAQRDPQATLPPLPSQIDIAATVTDPRGYNTVYVTDGFGNVIRKVDPLFNEWNFAYTCHGDIHRIVAPDPDNLARFGWGDGPLSSQVTTFDYDYIEDPPNPADCGLGSYHGNLESKTHPDGSIESWRFTNAAFPGRPTSYELKEPISGGYRSLRNETYLLDPAGGNVQEQRTVVQGVLVLNRQTPRPNPLAVLQNQANPLDVDDNGVVAPLDALLVIGELGRREVSNVATGVINSGATPPDYLDVDGVSSNNRFYISPVDALLVINELGSDPGFGSYEVPAPNTTLVTTYDYTSGGMLPAGLLQSMTDSAGRVVSWDYWDDTAEAGRFGQIKSITDPFDPSQGTTSNSVRRVSRDYDDFRRRSSVTNQRNASAEYQFDALDRLTGVLEPDPATGEASNGYATFLFYRPDGQLDRVLDANGVTTQFYYDTLDRLRGRIRADGSLSATTETYRDAAGLIRAAVNPMGEVSRLHYDPLGRRIARIEPEPDPNSPISPWQNPLLPRDVNADGTVDTLDLLAIDQYAGSFLPAWSLYHWSQRSYFYLDINGDNQVDNLDRTLLDVNGDGQIDAVDLAQHASQPIDPVVSPDRPITRYFFDNLGNQVGMRDANGNLTEYRYDERNQLRWMIEEHPTAAFATVQLEMSADPAALRQPGDPHSRPVTEYHVDAADQLRTQVDPLNRLSAWQYDELGRVIQLEQPELKNQGVSLGIPTHVFQYDNAGDLVQYQDPHGNLTRYYYDARHLPWSIVGANPGPFGDSTLPPVTTYTHDAAGNLESITELNDSSFQKRVTRLEYDAQDRMTLATLPAVATAGQASPVFPSLEWGYDAVDNVIWQRDPEGTLTQYRYDDLYRTRHILEDRPDPFPGTPYSGTVVSATNTTVTLPSAASATNGIYVDSLIQITAGRGRGQERRIRQYDGATRVATVDAAWLITPDAGSSYRIVSRPDPFSNIQTERQSRPVTSYGYSHVGAGRLERVTDPLDRQTLLTYDAAGRQLGLFEPSPDTGLPDPNSSPFQVFGLDPAGNVTRVTTAAPQAGGQPLVTQLEYDRLHRLTRQTHGFDTPDAAVTEFQHDLVSQLTSLSDPINNVTSWTYNALGLVDTESVRVDGNDYTRQYQYDRVGNLTRSIDRNGRAIDYQYDDLHRLQQEQWQGVGSLTIDYQYDQLGRLIGTSDPSHRLAFTLDEHNRPELVTMQFAGLSPTVQLAKSFDQAGNIRKVTAGVGASHDFVAEHGYDRLHRLTRTVQRGFDPATDRPLAGISSTAAVGVSDKLGTFTYDLGHQLGTIGRYDTQSGDLGGAAGFVNSEYVYDLNGRLDTLHHRRSSDDLVLAGYDWAYDRVSRVQSRDMLVPAYSDESVLAYGYNARHELTSVDRTSLDDSYAFDPNGNRTNSTTAGGTASYQLISPTDNDNRIARDGTFEYSYDAEGNLTQRTQLVGGNPTGATTVYTWDHRNRLFRVDERPAPGAAVTKSVEYRYDAFNQLIGRIVAPDGAAATMPLQETWFVYDRGQIVLQLEATGTADETVTHRYVWGPLVDQVLADERITMPGSAGTVSWALGDNLSTVRDWVDSSGNLIEHLAYDDFGNVTSDSAPSIDHLFAYTGRLLDQETGLQNNLHRWYDSHQGRWLNQDPIGFAALDSNLYRYVGNGPTGWLDPVGLLTLEQAEERQRQREIQKNTPQPTTYSSVSGEFFGTLWDTVKWWDNDDVALTATQIVEQGGSVTEAVAIASGDATGKVVGLENLQDAGEGRDRWGNQLGAWNRTRRGALGSFQLVGTAVGVKAGVGRCFTPGTLVRTADGSLPIETVRDGQRVQTYDLRQREWQTGTVTRTLVHDYTGDVYCLQLGDTTVESTGNHPFWVVSGRALLSRRHPEEVTAAEQDYTHGRWVCASDLEPGDVLLLLDGGPTVVDGITRREYRGPVYNLEIATHHNYAVAASGILVHNKGGVSSTLADDAGRVVAENSATTFFGRVITPSVDDLSRGVVKTFTGGRVTASVTQTETVLCRVWGEQAGRVGSFLTRAKPTSSAQAMFELSLDPAWGNSRVWLSEVRVPAGTPIYEGTAAAQGALRGGGNQIFIPREWLRDEWFQLPSVLR